MNIELSKETEALVAAAIAKGGFEKGRGRRSQHQLFHSLGVEKCADTPALNLMARVFGRQQRCRQFA